MKILKIGVNKGFENVIFFATKKFFCLCLLSDILIGIHWDSIFFFKVLQARLGDVDLSS